MAFKNDSGPFFLYFWSFDQKVQLFVKNDIIILIAYFLLNDQRLNENHAALVFTISLV
jgi:hypothetical protein